MRDGGGIMVSKSTAVNKPFFFSPDGEDLARALGPEQIQVPPHKRFVTRG